MRRTSSVVFNIAPVLPQHLNPKGPQTNHNAFVHPRSEFDMATSMLGSNNPTGTY
ncbi:hypothetical protein SCLCIDRAFT_29111 [Scleroderma citrinum Foug A]|uniref:Uncharacterized protein n=1 Tax=Scleroderma citrinum Foug A TaxID=1036808 RepID=A0A0C3DLB4_9AGAM|nr:hypothetical protein SCLCIDRAFT_29111 [Scleroderma citrinum Foug A]